MDRLLDYLDEFGLTDLEELSAEIRARSERKAREAIAALHDGDYDKTIHTDGLDEPIRIQCLVKVRGEEIEARHRSVDVENRADETGT